DFHVTGVQTCALPICHRRGDDLKDGAHAWIDWPKAVEHKPAFQWLHDRYPDRRRVLRASSAGGVLHAVKCGLGVAPLACAQALRSEERRVGTERRRGA